MVVVTDASPVIFLGKIDSLDLIDELFGGPLLIPSAVHKEILAGNLGTKRTSPTPYPWSTMSQVGGYALAPLLECGDEPGARVHSLFPG